MNTIGENVYVVEYPRVSNTPQKLVFESLEAAISEVRSLMNRKVETVNIAIANIAFPIAEPDRGVPASDLG